MVRDRPIEPDETFVVNYTWTDGGLPGPGDAIYIYVEAGIDDLSHPQEITITCSS